MPQVNVYIRDEDYPKWATIKKKSEFIHNALNINLDLNPYTNGAFQPIKTPKDARKAVEPLIGHKTYFKGKK